ncbi:MAG: hypothetical protein ABIO39_12430 [Caulobacteraceae bacterium]
MSSIVSNYRRPSFDHFEPQDDLSLTDQKKLRGQLEQIDVMAFASNKALTGQVLDHTDADKFQHLAVAAARARADWIAQALMIAHSGARPARAEIDQLHDLRIAFEELAEAYDGMRRMVERNYLPYR